MKTWTTGFFLKEWTTEQWTCVTPPPPTISQFLKVRIWCNAIDKLRISSDIETICIIISAHMYSYVFKTRAQLSRETFSFVCFAFNGFKVYFYIKGPESQTMFTYQWITKSLDKIFKIFPLIPNIIESSSSFLLMNQSTVIKLYV